MGVGIQRVGSKNPNVMYRPQAIVAHFHTEATDPLYQGTFGGSTAQQQGH